MTDQAPQKAQSAPERPQERRSPASLGDGSHPTRNAAPDDELARLTRIARAVRTTEAGPVYVVRLRDLEAAGYPALRRAQVVTVYRPWSSWLRRPWRLGDLLWSTVAWRIRSYSGRIAGHEATESHAMLYAGGGWCWSQGAKFGLVSLREYRGCRLSFWDGGLSAWQRDHVMGECAPHRGSRYGLRDIAALALFASTGRRAWLGALGDVHRWICSEAVCVLMRTAVEGYAGEGDCLRTPQDLADWMGGQGWQRLCLEVV